MKEKLLTARNISFYENDTDKHLKEDLCDVITCSSLFINEWYVYNICIKSVETVPIKAKSICF